MFQKKKIFINFFHTRSIEISFVITKRRVELLIKEILSFPRELSKNHAPLHGAVSFIFLPLSQVLNVSVDEEKKNRTNV